MTTSQNQSSLDTETSHFETNFPCLTDDQPNFETTLWNLGGKV